MNKHDSGEPWEYWGLWSKNDIDRVSHLLTSFDVRFSYSEIERSEEMLRDWCAWDSTALIPTIGYDLWIHEDDCAKIGYQIIEMFPERTFGYKK